MYVLPNILLLLLLYILQGLPNSTNWLMLKLSLKRGEEKVRKNGEREGRGEKKKVRKLKKLLKKLKKYQSKFVGSKITV